MLSRYAASLLILCLLISTAQAEIYTIKFDKDGMHVPKRCEWISSVSPWGATKTTDKGMALSYHLGPDDKVKDANKHGRPGGIKVHLRNRTNEFVSISVFAYCKDRSISKTALAFRPSGGFLKRGRDFHGNGCHGINITFQPRKEGIVDIATKGNGDYLIEKIEIIVKYNKKR